MKFGAHVREHGVAHDAPAIVARQPDRDQRHHRSGGEEDAPRVRVEHQRLANREHDHVASSPVDEAVDERGCLDDPEQAHQLVHPGLLRVRRQERAERAQDRHVHAGAAIEQAPAGPQAGRDREQPEHERERVRGRLAGAEPPDPEVQQQVEERRRAVVAQDAGDRAERV
jgi:hypothetical protein